MSPVERVTGFGDKQYPRVYSEARDRLKNDLMRAEKLFRDLPSFKKLPDEATFCLRLHPDMIAKSYDPVDIFTRAPGLRNVGSRNYRVDSREIAQTKSVAKKYKANDEIVSRLVFAQGNLSSYEGLMDLLDTAESRLPDSFKKEIRSIERLDLLLWNEQITDPALNSDDWTEGRLELVFHPSLSNPTTQMDFLNELLGGKESSRRFQTAQYADGPFFVSCRMDRESLAALRDVNPLRSVRRLDIADMPTLRSAPGLKLPSPPPAVSKSSIKVGVFDGGIEATHPHLITHSEDDQQFSVKTPVDEAAKAHGTAVAGIVLYGPFNDIKRTQELAVPDVSVVSFRVFPTSNSADIDLYEAIDIIENVVPARPDIKVYNLSFGPVGPISDDTVSRFTYVLDKLASDHKVSFVVAVGNDGEQPEPFNRIQAPADLVNGLGVGSYTILNGSKMHASYSCHGPGRECGKVKPELVAFGGCDSNPIHLLDLNSGTRAVSQGTSFSAPFVARLLAQATGLIERCSALLGRALIIHAVTDHGDEENRNKLGYGFSPLSIDEILECDSNKVTIVYQGEIPAKQTRRLPILLPPNLVGNGTVQVKWTIAALPKVDPRHPCDYTTICLEDTFYPNNLRFRYTPPNGSQEKPLIRKHGQDDISIQRLLSDGWRESVLPVSDSGKTFLAEETRRKGLKWESLVCKRASKRAENLHEPAIALHATPRHEASGSVDFAAVVTIEAKGYNGDLYDAILRTYVNLQPARIRAENEIRVRLS